MAAWRGALLLLLGSWGIWGCAAAAPQAEVRPPGPSETIAPSSARSEVGLASWYGSFHQGLLTASGEVFDMTRLTAAHRSLPLGARVRVTNMENGRVVRVRVNDRGPYVPGRIVDLSRQAAQVLGMIDHGVALVRLDLETTAGDIVLPAKASPSRPRHGAPGGWT
jgi:peptidoglycan lytic transglycosylase